MCGIAGFVSTRPFMGKALLAGMCDALVHRGPDDSGTVAWNGDKTVSDMGGKATVGLGHRRLSIIDLSAAGRQPMSNEDEHVWLVCNGEFYNYQERSDDLIRKGHVFRSRSDSETIIHLYEEVGLEATLKNMNGMFALGLWDGKKKTLFLARDRVGKKPLYYISLPDGSLAFASEIKALLAGGLVDRGRIDLVALAQFWTYGYIMGERTIFEQVRRLLPGHYASWREGKLTITQYWDCPFGVDCFVNRGLDDLCDELEDLLRDAVRIRLVSDVPLGLFLSGGVDSSVIAALACEVTNRQMKSFTIAFRQDAFNEAPFAGAVARHLGMANEVLTVEESMQDQFGRIASHFDEPFGDSSAIPTFFVSKLARQRVTVTLTGDGGDELFAGYDNYAEGLRLWGDRRQRRVFEKKAHGMARIWDMKRRLTPESARLMAWERVLGPFKRRRIFSEYFLSKVKDDEIYSDRRRWCEGPANADLLSRMQRLNFKTYLPDDILVKVDRMSMAHALECRNPFLDYRVVEFAAKLPYSAKIDEQGGRKIILRRILSRRVPSSLVERPKQGFAVPWPDWCKGGLGADLRKRWRSFRSPLFRNDAADRLFPLDGEGDAFLQWYAYCTLNFFAGNT